MGYFLDPRMARGVLKVSIFNSGSATLNVGKQACHRHCVKHRIPKKRVATPLCGLTQYNMCATPGVSTVRIKWIVRMHIVLVCLSLQPEWAVGNTLVLF